MQASATSDEHTAATTSIGIPAQPAEQQQQNISKAGHTTNTPAQLGSSPMLSIASSQQKGPASGGATMGTATLTEDPQSMAEDQRQPLTLQTIAREVLGSEQGRQVAQAAAHMWGNFISGMEMAADHDN